MTFYEFECPLCGNRFNRTYTNQLVCKSCENKPEAIALGNGKITVSLGTHELGAAHSSFGTLDPNHDRRNRNLPEVPMMITNPTMRQEAPYPTVLKELVESLQYRPNWRFSLAHHDRGQDSIGLTLIIVTCGYDSYNPEGGETYRVQHFMPVPPAAYNEQSWRRWLFNQCLAVETHECAEFFKINGKRPYAPHHGPGNDPYVVFERGTDEEARTMYTGEVRPEIRKALDQQKDNHEVRPVVKHGAGGEKLGASGVVSDPGKDNRGQGEVSHGPRGETSGGWGDKVQKAYPK